MRKYKFEDTDPTMLRFAKPCVRGHCGPDGQGVRYKHACERTGACLACSFRLPLGAFTKQFPADIVEPKYQSRTKEEARIAHIEQVMNYQKRNPDKVKEIRKKYWSKPEIKEKQRLLSAERYKNFTEEQKEALLKRNAEWRLKNLEYCKQTDKERKRKAREIISNEGEGKKSSIGSEGMDSQDVPRIH